MHLLWNVLLVNMKFLIMNCITCIHIRIMYVKQISSYIIQTLSSSLRFVKDNFVGWVWKLENPPKPHAFTNLPLQSANIDITTNLPVVDLSVKTTRTIQACRALPTPFELRVAAGNNPRQLVLNRDAQILDFQRMRAELTADINRAKERNDYGDLFYGIKRELYTHIDYGIFFRKQIVNNTLFYMNTEYSRSLIDYSVGFYPVCLPFFNYLFFLVGTTEAIPVGTIIRVVYKMYSDEMFRVCLWGFYDTHKNIIDIIFIIFIILLCLIIPMFSSYVCWILL